MSDKEIHIVFKVINFIFGEESREFNLKHVDKNILMALAKHHGPKGIYPALTTLATELDVGVRYLQRRLEHLKGIGLVQIKNTGGRSNRYILSFLEFNNSTTHGLQTHGLQDRGGLQTVAYRPPTHGLQVHDPRSTDRPIRTDNQNKGSEQREKQKHGASRLPLSDFFKPDEQRQKLVMETCAKCSITEQSLMAKFRALQKTKDKVSSDWNAELELFLINERPSRDVVKPQAQQSGLQPTTAAYRDYFDEEKLKEREYWAKKLEERKNARKLLEGKK